MEKSERAIIKDWLRRYGMYKAKTKRLKNNPGRQQEYQEALHIVTTLDVAMTTISREEQRLLRARFFKRRSWTRLSIEMHYSERWLRELCNRAADKLASVIFKP